MVYMMAAMMVVLMVEMTADMMELMKVVMTVYMMVVMKELIHKWCKYKNLKLKHKQSYLFLIHLTSY